MAGRQHKAVSPVFRKRSMERSKYNVDKDVEQRTCDGIVFASILEMKYYRDVLCPLVKSGKVTDYELQKPYELQPEFTHNGKSIKSIQYVADFFIRYKDGREEVIDTKGCPDSTAHIKRKLFWFRYPDTAYHWVCYSKRDGGWCEYEYVKKRRAERKRIKKMGQKENKENEQGK